MAEDLDKKMEPEISEAADKAADEIKDQRRLGPRSVGMHDVAIVGITAEDVGDNLTESLRIETFVDVLDSSMDVLLGGRDSTLHVAVVHLF